MKKLQSVRLWFAGLRSWDRCWVCGIGAVLALSIALLSLNLYEKVTNLDAPNPALVEQERQKEAQERQKEANQNRKAEQPDEDSPSTLSLWYSNPLWLRLTMIVLVGIVVFNVVTAKDSSPPHHESDDDLKW